MIKTKDTKGITLVALVVSIIVLLILAGVTISLVLAPNGILQKAEQAKKEIEKAEEIEKLQLVVIASIMEQESIEEEELRKALKTEIDKGEIELYKTGDIYDVLFKKTMRYYEIDENGVVEGGEELIIDHQPGDITKGIHGNSLKGTEDSPYEINCIEDLVAFSNVVNGSGYKLENGVPVQVGISNNILTGKYVVLKRNLNFKSKFSYTDCKRTDFGDINGNLEDGNELITEMTTGKGFKPIGYDRTCYTNFDGSHKQIRNIYINYTDKSDKGAVGLFSAATNSTIKNIELTGKISGNWHAGGIVADGGRVNNTLIENCINYAEITGNNMVGGIAGNSNTILNCINYGNINITGMSYSYGGGAGIAGYAGVKIEKCINYGEIKGKATLSGICGCTDKELLLKNNLNYGNVIGEDSRNGLGGIMGFNSSGNVRILNCRNEGDIRGNCFNGGIIGYLMGGNWNSEVYLTIQNCCNTGNITSENTTAGGLVGIQGTLAAKCYVTIENSWNMGDVKGKKVGGIQGSIERYNATDTKTEYNQVFYINTLAVPEGVTYTGEAIRKTIEEIKSQEFVNLLNHNIGQNTEWKNWKLGQNGYPTFE